MSDPFDDFLDNGFKCETNDALKNAIRARTNAMLRRRRFVRRLAFVGLAAACYLAGMTTMWLLAPQTATIGEVPAQPVIVAENKRAPEPETELPERPEIYEIEAQNAQGAERFAQLRKAGDLYLSLEHNYASAVRCYSQAFDAGGEQALEYSPDDNWLVMVIKNARRKDKRR
jgi:hypothetical protein